MPTETTYPYIGQYYSNPNLYSISTDGICTPSNIVSMP
jgi:hypothetical protein